MRLDSNIKSKSSNNTYLNIVKILYLIFFHYKHQQIQKFTKASTRKKGLFKWGKTLFTKRERSLIFSGLEKSTFLKSMLVLNFLIRWSWNILNKNNILMVLNKCLIRWFWVNVTPKPHISTMLNKILIQWFSMLLQNLIILSHLNYLHSSSGITFREVAPFQIRGSPTW